MGIFRLYSGDDGESHMEELDLASHPELAALHSAKGVVFRSTPPGSLSDWHAAPRRQSVPRRELSVLPEREGREQRPEGPGRVFDGEQ